MSFDPASATAAYLAEVPQALRSAAERHAEAGAAGWALGWIGPLVLAGLMLRTGLVEQVRRSGGLAVIGLLALVSCGWELASRAIADGGLPTGALGALGVGVVIRLVLLCALWGLLRLAGSRPRLGLGSVAAAMSFFLVFGPTAISELAGAAEPLASGPAAVAALQLARSSGVAASAVAVSPAAPGEGDVTGLLKPARVLLSPEAAKASVAEVRAAVGHVLGHYRARDGLAWAAVLAVLSVLGCCFVVGLQGPAGRMLNGARLRPRFHRDDRDELSDPRRLPVLWALASVWIAIATPAAFAFDRAVNLRADRFSLEHAREPDGLAKALIRENGLQPVDPPAWQLWLTCNHPALKDRVEQAMRWKADQASN